MRVKVCRRSTLVVHADAVNAPQPGITAIPRQSLACLHDGYKVETRRLRVLVCKVVVALR